MAADRKAAEEQGQQLHQHLDLAEAEVQAEVSLGEALARTKKNDIANTMYFLVYVFIEICPIYNFFLALSLNTCDSNTHARESNLARTHEIATTNTLGDEHRFSVYSPHANCN